MKKLLLLTFCLVSLAGTAQLTAWKNAFPGYPALPKSNVQLKDSTAAENLCYSDSEVLLFGYRIDKDSIQICLYEENDDVNNLTLLKKIKNTRGLYYYTNSIIAFYHKKNIYAISDNYFYKYVNNNWVNTKIYINYKFQYPAILKIKKYRDDIYFFSNCDSVGGQRMKGGARWDGTKFNALDTLVDSIYYAFVKNDTLFMLKANGDVLIQYGNIVTTVSNPYKNNLSFSNWGYMFETKDNICVMSPKISEGYLVTSTGVKKDLNYQSMPQWISASVLFNNIPLLGTGTLATPIYANYFALLDGHTFRDPLILESIFTFDQHKWNSYRSINLEVYHNRLYAMDWIDTVNANGDTLRYIACLNSGLNKISGTIYNDENNNCKMDNGEKPVKNRLVEITPGPNIISTDTNGEYVSFLPIGDYKIAVDTFKYWQMTPCNNFSTNIKITDTSQFANINNKDFALTKRKNIHDLSVNLVGNTGWRVRRGFTELYSLLISNEGTIAEKPELSLTVPNNLSIINSNITPTSKSGNTYTWSIDSVQSDSSVQIIFSVLMDINYINLKDSIHFYAAVLPVSSDTVIKDNYDTLKQYVVASFDPNSKQVWPYGSDYVNIISPDVNEVEYLINFENIGNDTASNIYIYDTINTNLDVHHIKLTGSSHQCVPSVLACNPFHGKCVLKWSFNNINLPPKTNTSDYVLNRGHVGYKISLAENLPLKTRIKNKAYIYFDYNTPIVTNTSILMIDTSAKLIDTSLGIFNQFISEKNSITIYPNPTNEILNLQNNSIENLNITMCDMMGRTISKTYITANETKQIDMRNFSDGLYIIWVEGKPTPIKVIKR